MPFTAFVLGDTLYVYIIFYILGTYWYHSHTRKQREKGLQGAFIIKPKRPRFPDVIDDPGKQTIAIQEWHHGENCTMTDSILVNGKGRISSFEKFSCTEDDAVKFRNGYNANLKKTILPPSLLAKMYRKGELLQQYYEV